MKFLHTADIHLDSPLLGLSRHDAIPTDLTAGCTRRAFQSLIDIAIKEDVAFIVIAGDLYDGDWRDYSTGLFFAHEMQRLNRPCILVRGNHDAASLITKSLTMPPNVHVFSERRAHTLTVLEEFGVAIHGRSFPNRAVTENLSETYPAPVPGLFNIGVLHTSADDPGEHAAYAPCNPAELALKGYQYWALGHIHQRRELSQKPWIVFPGNIQGRHARETGAKGCTIVEAEGQDVIGVTHHVTDVLRWEACAIDAEGSAHFDHLALQIQFRLNEIAETADHRPLIVRIYIDGRTPLHAELLADPSRIEAECRSVAFSAPGRIHIEKVLIRTKEVQTDAPHDLDAIAQLSSRFHEALEDPDLQARLLEEFRGLERLVPALPGHPARPVWTAEELRALVPDSWQEVAYRLQKRAMP